MLKFFSNFYTTNKQSAFTLAEVLITLAIIGVVAALTIPNLVMKYKEKATVTKVQKAYSVINSAYKMALANNGELSTWGFTKNSTIEEDEEGNSYLAGDTMKNINILWNTIGKHLNIVDKCMPEQSNCYRPETLYNLNLEDCNSEVDKLSFLTLNDGTTILGGWIENFSCNNKNDMCGDFAIDINGIRNLPNAKGRDIFYFKIYPDRIVPMGEDPEEFNAFDKSCNRVNSTVSSSHIGYGCTAWVVEKGNMDYLHCDDLSWTGKQKCSE